VLVGPHRPHLLIKHRYATGSLSFDSALKVAYFRGRLASSLARDPAYKGSMLAVSFSEAQMEVYLIKFQKEYPSQDIYFMHQQYQIGHPGGNFRRHYCHQCPSGDRRNPRTEASGGRCLPYTTYEEIIAGI
jgi:hypothetical protein